MRRVTPLLIAAGASATLTGSVAVVLALIGVFSYQLIRADRLAEPGGFRSLELTVPQIEELSSIDLPSGSEVLNSEYQSALDWHMTARIRLPEGHQAPILDPSLTWDGSNIGPDGVVREVADTVDENGRITLDIRAFTT